MHNRYLGGILLVIAIDLLAVCPNSMADIALPKLFSDHMILQQNQSMRISGTADAGERLTVTFSKQTVDAVADEEGHWTAIISTGPAGGPYHLEVASADSDTKVEFHDVLVGEVWICGGQSNMQFPISRSSNAKSEIDAAKKFPTIRVFDVDHNASPEPLDDFAKVDSWFCCSSDSIKEFSAIAYLFGRELGKKLDIPIGLINVSRDGTTLEAWTPFDVLESDGSFSELLKHWEERDEPNNPNRVSNSFNGMVAPLAGFAFRGVIWYQGEGNVGRGAQYRRMFPLMIKSWREKLRQKNCPFYFVQPTPFRYQERTVESLPEIWDAQLKAFKEVSNTGMVVTTDLGDPSNVHPAEKFPVAERLSRWAFAGCYADFINQNEKEKQASTEDEPKLPRASSSNEIESQPKDTEEKESVAKKVASISGPIYESAKVEGDRIVVSFRFSDTKLVLDPAVGNQFTVCGPDRKFVPARVQIIGLNVEVFHAEIPDPVAVRYAWMDTAEASLTNAEGLPASPFRTDDFPLLSDGVEF